MKKIIFMLIPLLLIVLAFIPLNDRTISGKVSDEKGQPLSGVSVTIKGTRTATTTDASGNFKLVTSRNNPTLIFAAAGYETLEIKAGTQEVVNASLKFSINDLNEVVVTGYGIRKDEEVSTLRSRDIPGNSLVAPGTYLSGKAAGLSISYRNGFYPDKNLNYTDSQSVDFNTEEYDHIVENPFLKVSDNPLSTFSIDVDAASYSNVRRFLKAGELPPAGAVRIEEMVNYFHYEYPQPVKNDPFSVNTEISECPWNKDHQLVLVGLQGKKISTEDLPASNLVFLIDVSGSMMEPNKLPLVQASMKLLVDQLREQDKVSLVVYAGNAGMVLPPTSGAERTKIKDAIDRLEAGGSTAGGEGIKLAYKTAMENFMKKGNNRVILCTDGDFNVGASSDDELERLIESERNSGVFLTVLGFGTGNYKDSKMETLADKGNGNHAYIDELSEAKKVLVSEFGGTVFTIAKDVKLQIEFNPAKVQGYRLIGYENRMLNKEDFNDDKKDAGELGSGHTVTALYEVIPVGIEDSFLRKVDGLRYQKNKSSLTRASSGDEVMNIKLRFKQPTGDSSSLIEHPVMDSRPNITGTSNNFRFAAAVAEFGMLLRQSGYRSASSFSNVSRLAKNAIGPDLEGYRKEFITLVAKAQAISRKNGSEEPDDDEVGKND